MPIRLVLPRGAWGSLQYWMKGAALVLIASHVGNAEAATGVTIEAVDVYCDGATACHTNALGCTNLCNNAANVDGLWNTLNSAGGWTLSHRYTDGMVYDSDFVDPERTAGGADTFYFDQSITAIGMFSGHGVCGNNVPPWKECNTASDCSAGQVCFGRGPGVSGYLYWGSCIQDAPRYLVTHGTASYFGDAVTYGTGMVGLGETTYAGSWGGAGTNGGLSFAIFDVSCGLFAPYWWSELGNAFAGVQNVATIMPTSMGSDTTDSPSRGSAFAAGYLANPNASISHDWIVALNSVPQNDGERCGLQAPNWSHGGGHGIYGCGANASMSVDISPTWAQWNNGTESWIQAKNQFYASAGNGYWASIWLCNYDCNTYPIYR